MEGVRCVSAPVPGESDSSLGALTVSGPVYRMTPERAHQLGPEIAAAAHRLGEAGAPARPGALPRPARRIPAAAFTEGHAFYGRAPIWDAASASLVWLDAYRARPVGHAGRPAGRPAFAPRCWRVSPPRDRADRRPPAAAGSSAPPAARCRWRATARRSLSAGVPADLSAVATCAASEASPLDRPRGTAAAGRG